MSKRLTYSKQADGSLLSRHVVLDSSGTQLRAKLSGNGLEWTVLNAVNNVVVQSGSAKSPHLSKMAVKRALMGLGVTFESETRKGSSDEQTAS